MAARTAPGSPRRNDRGSGLLGTAAGVAAFLVLLLFAVQVLFNLYATSVVTAAAYDAARSVAAAGGSPNARDDALARARRVLGRYYERVSFDWSDSTDAQVALHVRADNDDGVLAAMRLDPIRRVDRTVRVRVECLRSSDDGACRP